MDLFAQARRQMLAGQLNDNRERLMRSFEGLTSDDMLRPGVNGDWSIRDLLVHLASWDRATTEAFRGMLQGEHPPFLDLDSQGVEEFNASQYPTFSGFAPEEAMAELIAAREELVAVLRDVDNTALFAPAPGDEHADLSIAACIEVTADHDAEHAEMIENWRDQEGL